MIGRFTGRFSRSFVTSAWVQATGRFLRRHLWAWPIIAAVILGVSGWWVQGSVDAAMREQRAAQLKTILDADVAALKNWMTNQERTVELVAGDVRLQPLVRDLIPLADGKPESSRALADSKAQEGLRHHLDVRVRGYDYTGYFLVTPTGVVAACDHEAALGKSLGGYRQQFIEQVLNGRPAVSRPYRSPLLLKDETGELRANLPTMLAASAVPGADGKPMGVLALRVQPDVGFTKILQIAQTGRTGETYALDKDGRFLSQSRFDEDLKEIGLLADLPDARSVLTLESKDPGADMSEGARPKARRMHQPLTKPAQEIAAGTDGIDPDGYRDYRGTPVVGAWTWLPDYGFGVVTEVDVKEAFQPVYLLRRAFWGLMVLLGLAAVVIFLAMMFIARQQRALQAAALEAKQLGQYTLMEKLGAGGMGTVYRARHAMLRRPTAVKLLDIANMSDAAVTRFEREVQATAGLTHPNTIAIFDYGRTPEGIFYYAMEYLDGNNLDNLVALAGPLPEARAVHLLRQICGSIAEAHATGLVHRDIKPANIFITRRGGLADFVKVLDFGLVKAVGGAGEANVTAAGAATGTPLYMSPEAVEHAEDVGPASDVYAIGAVAYFLLTGAPVFTGDAIIDILMKHVYDAPEPPSQRAGRPFSPSLEQLILHCLAKKRADRPPDAAALLRELDACTFEGQWSSADADAWWANPPVARPRPASNGAPSATPSSSAAAVEMTTVYSGENT